MEIFRQWELETAVTETGLPRQWSDSFYLGETLLAAEFRRLDLFGEEFVLPIAGHDPRLPESAAPLTVHVIDDPAWAEEYGLGAGGMVLVRPDGHIAWRIRETPGDHSASICQAIRTATAT